jgi:hypothetical protein
MVRRPGLLTKMPLDQPFRQLLSVNGNTFPAHRV